MSFCLGTGSEARDRTTAARRIRGPRAVGALALGAALVLGAAGCGGGSGEARLEGGAPPGSVAEASPGGSGDVSPGESPGQVRRTARIRVAGHPVTVEIADTPELRRRGLMHRDSLAEDHGMLFVYPESRILSFWMVNTRIPLDIAFIDESGVIVDIQGMEPQSDEQHVSEREAMYALEMSAGWFEEHGVEVGDRVEL